MKKLIMAACVPALVLVAACGGGTSGAGDAAGDASPAVVASPSASSSPSGTPTPSATPTPTPTIVELAAEDLIDGFPTPYDIAKAQGAKFYAVKNFPVWTQTLPLTKKHAGQIYFGDVQSARPKVCEAVTYYFNGGFTRKIATSDLVTAAGFSNNTEKNQYLGRKIYVWKTVAYVMQPGVANQTVINTKALSKKCLYFKAVLRNGDIQSEGYSKLKTYKSGNSMVQSPPAANGGRTRSYYIAEAIGDVLYQTFIQTDSSKISGVTKLYNSRANKLAAFQGVTRPGVNFAHLQPLTADPSTYKEIVVNGEGFA